MKKAQKIISQFLDRFPSSQFSSDEERVRFDQVKQKLNSADDLGGELRTLYKVRGFSDLALSLLWVAERMERDSSRLEILPEEESVVRQHLGATFGSAMPDADSELPTVPPTPAEEVFASPGPVVEEPQASQPAVPPAVPSSVPVASGSEGEFAALVEKFVEAMQSGDDARNDLISQVRQQAQGFVGSEAPEMLRKYCQHLQEFLDYVEQNQFMDDVRTMNILSNITSPLSQWAAAAPEQQPGLLDEGVATLMDFKSLFE